MGIWSKLKGEINQDDELDDEKYDEDVFDDYPPASEENNNTSSSFGSASSGTLELKVVRPEGYEAVTQIADHLLNNRTVVLNLEATNKETARRLIDFLSGVAYSIDGNLKRVANNTFVITPCNVDVTGEPLKEAAKPKQAPAPSQDEGFGF